MQQALRGPRSVLQLAVGSCVEAVILTMRGRNDGGGRPLKTSPRRNVVVRMLTMQPPGRNRGR